MTINLFYVLLCLLVVFEGIHSARRLRDCDDFCYELAERNFKLAQRVGHLERQAETLTPFIKRIKCITIADDSGTSDAPSQT